MKLTILRSVSTTSGLLVEGTQPEVDDKLGAMLVKRGYAEQFAEPETKEADEPDEIKPLPTRKPRKSRK